MKAQLFCVGMFQKRNKEYISFIQLSNIDLVSQPCKMFTNP